MTDERDHTRTDRWIHLVLRWGMILSMSVMLLGLALFALSPTGHQEVDLSLGEMVDGVLEGNPIAIIDLGIIMLIATPLTRVLTTLAIFIVGREPRFILASLLVLAVISVAVLIG